MTDGSDNGPACVLDGWLQARLDPAPLDWLRGAVDDAASLDDARLERTLAMAGRKAGRGPLLPTSAERVQADAVCPGWSPVDWTLADAARAMILCKRAGTQDGFGATFRALCRTADLSGLTGLYRASPLLPQDADLDWQLGEGLRTSISAIFQAIAHRNPLPAERFDDHRWNHMVLKALFIETSLPPIIGLDRRRNAALAVTLTDHVHERRAAGRPVDLHVWRCIAPFAAGAVLDEITPLATSTDPRQRRAAALFLNESPDPAAAVMLDGLRPECAEIAAGRLDWSALDD